jgi:hypothetical protein
MMLVNGLCLKLHFCTPGVVRTSTESTPYKGAISPFPFDPIIALRHSSHFTYPFIILHHLNPDSVITNLHTFPSLSVSFLLMASLAPIDVFFPLWEGQNVHRHCQKFHIFIFSLMFVPCIAWLGIIDQHYALLHYCVQLSAAGHSYARNYNIRCTQATIIYSTGVHLDDTTISDFQVTHKDKGRSLKMAHKCQNT